MLKGKTTIELTHVETKKTERYVEENLITNAVPDLLRLNPSGLMYPIQLHRAVEFGKELFPLATKCYGGILLFENPLEEDAKKIIVPSDNPIVGYSSNDVNETDNPKRGSANLTESGQIENGYKFVWDFSTSQGNGRISALALTHYNGGKNFYGDAYSKEHVALRLNFNLVNVTDEILKTYIGMVEADPINNRFVSIWPLKNKSLEIRTFSEAMTSVGLNDPISREMVQSVDKNTIGIEGFYTGVGTFQWHYSDFFDGKDGYYYGFIISERKSTYTMLNRIKINKEDFTTTIDYWTLENIKLNQIGAYPLEDNYGATRQKYCVVKRGYLYTISEDNTALYKININNPIDVAKIELGFKTSYTGGHNTYSYIYEWGDYILGYAFVLDKNDHVIKTPATTFENVMTPLIEIGPFRIGYGSSTANNSRLLYKNLYLHTPYLGTINNLSTPILKTADKTMKITYTLTETEETL